MGELDIQFNGEPFDPESEYEQLMGEDALERQRRLGRERYSCCLAQKSEGHLIMCPKHPLRK